jgi:FAD/FMN-containing dehydrogenase
MRPYLIAVPRRDSDDVPAAIRFAKANKKYLVARSGGHQYSGLSSGGEDTILLSMERFKHLEIKTADGKTVARVGAGMLLTDVAAEFKRHGVTIPHGECPHVAIGGHAQSGGYGHLIRSYGLALDHVVEFKIYTAEGALRTVRRPPTQDRSSLFWGVLGGGPGSFGVVTEFTFECVRDTDHRYSWGSGRFYVYERRLFNAAMNEVKDWTEKIASKDPRLPPDADMSMSIIDAKFFGKPVYALELVNGNRDGREASIADSSSRLAATSSAAPRGGIETESPSGGSWATAPCRSCPMHSSAAETSPKRGGSTTSPTRNVSTVRSDP